MKAVEAIKTLKINGMDVSGRASESILEIARENNIFIPTLCFLEGLSGYGACRLCIVEVKGTPKLLPACTTRIEEGMEVTTDSERLASYRKMILGMIFAERNHFCAVCVSNGHCELQSMAMTLGMEHSLAPYLYGKFSVDASHKSFVSDHNRCILCARCVRVCDEIEGAHAWDIMARGTNARVIHDFNEPWGDSDSCTSCGKCVNVCPTGALFEKGVAAGEMSKKTNFLENLRMMRESDDE
jgi:bidirectional [NiFe] hydrogenase diaphorase subunit